MSDPFPEDVARLFWDVDPACVDLVRHRDYVIERVMARGGWGAMRWLRTTYSVDVLSQFLRSKGQRLSPRDRAYWTLVCGMAAPTQPGGARPPWAGP